MTASVSLRLENFKETSFAMVSRNVCFLMCVLKCSFVGQVASKVSGRLVIDSGEMVWWIN